MVQAPGVRPQERPEPDAQQMHLGQVLGAELPVPKALAYVCERRAGLQVFLEDADVPMDTNHLERALRVIPMGRRNWNFCWTEVGARHASCKA